MQDSFTGPLTPSLERAGLQGIGAKVTLGGEALKIAGSGSGELVVAAADVERIRVAAFRGGRFGPSFETTIWLERGGEPILVMPQRRAEGYALVIRRFAGAVAAAGGLERVWRGPGLRTAVINMILVMGSLGGLLAVLIYAAIDSGNWPWMLAAALFGIVYLLLLRNQILWHWPRRLRGLQELDFLLPTEADR